MSFVCIKCHDAHYEGLHIMTSYGPCEDCHETGVCYDCQCTYVKKKEKKEEKDD